MVDDMSIFYHGTTRRRARQIRRDGFSPRPPSRRVWFTRHQYMALRRARHKASRAPGDQPAVLICEIDVGALTRYVGSGRVFHTRGVLSVRGFVPPSVLRGDVADRRPDRLDMPDEPSVLARWINQLLERKRTSQNPNYEISRAEIAQVDAR
jgi:hypothetical protein